jgi:hypothetical protein
MKKSLYLLASLTVWSLQASKQTEDSISHENVTHALSTLTPPEKQPDNTIQRNTLDLSQVNSSTEKSAIGFGSIELGLARVEKELADVRATLADIKTSAVAHAQDEQAKRAQIKEANAALTAENTQLKEEIVRLHSEQTIREASLRDSTQAAIDEEDEDDDSIDIEEDASETQDLVAIIANDGDEEAE